MNKAALVTGGSRGVGLTMARMLGKEGYALTILGQQPHRVRAAEASLRQEGYTVAGIAGDIALEPTIQAVVEQHKARYGRLDVLVNNAGVTGADLINCYPTEQLDQMLAVTLRAPIVFYRECLEMLRAAGAEHGAALVVNISSTSGKRGNANVDVYAATKFGVLGFSQSMAHELGNLGISSCAICPGVVNTDMGQWAREWLSPEEMVQPEQVAETVRVLLGKKPAEVPLEIVLRTPGWAKIADALGLPAHEVSPV